MSSSDLHSPNFKPSAGCFSLFPVSFYLCKWYLQGAHCRVTPSSCRVAAPCSSHHLWPGNCFHPSHKVFVVDLIPLWSSPEWVQAWMDLNVVTIPSDSWREVGGPAGFCRNSSLTVWDICLFVAGGESIGSSVTVWMDLCLLGGSDYPQSLQSTRTESDLRRESDLKTSLTSACN